jgi:hypothetical protein
MLEIILPIVLAPLVGYVTDRFLYGRAIKKTAEQILAERQRLGVSGSDY